MGKEGREGGEGQGKGKGNYGKGERGESVPLALILQLDHLFLLRWDSSFPFWRHYFVLMQLHSNTVLFLVNFYYTEFFV